jgi:hypothetical protein
MNNNWLKVLVAIAAIMIAGSAAYFSVTGLGVLFSGAAVAVMVMAGSLEFAKLVTATYLKQEWDNVKGVNKWYLTSAVVILMAITSAGIFGYLSNAFQQQNLKLEQVQREIDVWNNKISTDTSQIALYTNQLNQLQANNNTVLGNNTNRSSLRFATSTSKEQSKIRTKISALNDSIVAYNGKINDIKNNNIDIEREVGGFRFVAEAFGVELKSVVKFFIILIVVVFDPLAVALVISFNQLVLTTKRKDEDDDIKPQPDKDVDVKEVIEEESRIKLSEEDLKKLEEVLMNPPPPNEQLKEAAKRYSEEVREKHTHIDDFVVDEQVEKKEAFGEMLVKPQPTQEERHELLVEMMKNDQELGLYDEPFDNPMIKEPVVSDNPTVEQEKTQLQKLEEYVNPIQEESQNDNISDWDVTLMDGLEDEPSFFTEEETENIFQEEPTEEEVQENFSTIEPETENIFQEAEQFDIPIDESIDNEPELTFSDEFISEAIDEFNIESIKEEIEDTRVDVNEINNTLDVVNNEMDNSVIEEIQEKKKF